MGLGAPRLRVWRMGAFVPEFTADLGGFLAHWPRAFGAQPGTDALVRPDTGGVWGMSIIDLEALLRPLSEEAPCGRDCEYDPVFGELERAAAGKPEQSMGDTVIAGEPPDWVGVLSHSQALFAETLDLRVAILMTRAAMQAEGLPALGSGLALIAGLLTQFWDHVYPQLDAEDDNDPTLRVNSLLALNDRAGFVAELLNLTIVQERQLGRFSMRDVKLASGDLDPAEDEDRPDPALIAGAFAGTDLDALQASAEAVELALTQFDAISSILDDRVGAAGPDLSLLGSELKGVQRLLAEHLERRGVGSDSAGQAEADEESAGVGGVVATGEIRSRDDAIRSLDRICDYFREHEPSSPVPMLLERAKRLVAMSFVEILQDLSPSGVPEAMNVVGVSDPEG